jgi:hypothetical protein
MATRATDVADLDPWAAMHRADTPLVLEPGHPPQGAWLAQLLARPPFAWRAEGPPEALASLVPDAPAELRELVDAAAHRFAQLMGCTRLKLRVELVDSNACTKVHADYTDVRLIQTLAGPGTDYAPEGDADAPLARVPTGWTGLFKGALYPARDGKAHAPCLHRSPPIAGSGVRRLLLVLDTATTAAPN